MDRYFPLAFQIALGSGAVEVRLLGEVEVRQEGALLDVARPSCRALLAMLSLKAGRPVDVDEIVDGLWTSARPEDPLAAVQVTVSRLRRTLGLQRSAVGRTTRGYILQVEPGDVDVGRVETAVSETNRLAAAGEVEAVAKKSRGALLEWRGQPLLEFVDRPFAAPAAARIHSARVALITARNDALLALGRSEEVLGDTEEQVESDPLSERLAGQLMVALHQCGRSTEALAVYSRLCSALRADLGISPSPLLRDLHRQILDHDPALARVIPVGRAHVRDRYFLGFPPAPKDDLELHAGDTGSRLLAALVAAGDPASDATRSRLLTALGEAKHYLGEPDWPATLIQAGRLARAVQDSSGVASAVTAGALGWSTSPGRPDPGRMELIDYALEHAEQLDSRLHARLLVSKANELAVGGPLRSRLELTEAGISLARSSGDPLVLLSVLSQGYGAIWAPATLGRRRQIALEAAALADAGGQVVVSATTIGFLMGAAIEEGDRLAADRYFQRFSDIADQLDLSVLRWGVALHGSWMAILDGDLGLADRLAADARVRGQQAGRPEAEMVFVCQIAALRWAQGALGDRDVVGALEQLVASGMAGFRGLYTLAVLASGASQRAGELLTAERLADTVGTLPEDPLYLSNLVHWSELVYLLGRRSEAEVLLWALEPYLEHFAFTGGAVYGPVSHVVGLLQLTLGRVEAAARSLRRAARQTKAMLTPFFSQRVETTLTQHGLNAR